MLPKNPAPRSREHSHDVAEAAKADLLIECKLRTPASGPGGSACLRPGHATLLCGSILRHKLQQHDVALGEESSPARLISLPLSLLPSETSPPTVARWAGRRVVFVRGRPRVEPPPQRSGASRRGARHARGSRGTDLVCGLVAHESSGDTKRFYGIPFRSPPLAQKLVSPKDLRSLYF
eukprot:scaffold1511_cov347-Prasinococcus_capsulatus_cf.AAC.4